MSEMASKGRAARRARLAAAEPRAERWQIYAVIKRQVDRPMDDASERAYLARVMARIHQEQAAAGAGAVRVGNELARLRRWWNDPESREATQVLDRAQNLPLLEGLEVEAHTRARRLRRLSLQARHPYFGRVDFQEHTPHAEDSPEAFYVGLGGVWDADGWPLVIDWRTPVAGLYYEAETGPAQFWGPGGRVAGEVSLKRQYQVEGGALVGYFDTDLHIGDELLSRAMAVSGRVKMSSIVTSIQREQNRAIRDVTHPVLIVSGPAGSGKTAVALQRLAYLLYHRPNLSAGDILFIVPNRVFADYVSDVLPELGEDNPRYATWEDIVRDWLPVERWEQRADVVNAWVAGTAPATRRAGVALRGHPGLVARLDRFVEHLDTTAPPFRDVVWEGVVLATANDLTQWWLERWQGRPPAVRLGLVADQVRERMGRARRRVSQRVRTALIESQTLVSDEDLNQTLQQRLDEGEAQLTHWLASGLIVDWLALYIQLYEDEGSWAELAKEVGIADVGAVLAEIQQRLSTDPLPFEDVPPLAYLKASLCRPNMPWRVRLLMVEEAHELTPCQLAVLNRLMPGVPATLVGDAEQIVVDGLSWRIGDARPPVELQDTAVREVRLTKSYRSTPAITRLTDALRGEAGADAQYEAVVWSAVQDAPPPNVARVGSDAEWCDAMVKFVEQSPPRSTVGIVCSTTAEAEAVAALMAPSLKSRLRLMVNPDGAFAGGIMVLPLWLAVGLEFDTVIVADVAAYRAAGGRRQLYVAASRARHRLSLVCRGALPSWFPPSDLWRGAGVSVDS